MTSDEFANMDTTKRVIMVNQLLSKEKSDALKNVAKKLGLNYSSFTKEMRKEDFSYNQSKRQYEKIISVEDFQKIKGELNQNDDQVYSYLSDHFDDLKRLLSESNQSLNLDKSVYDPNAKLVIKSIKVNNEIYSQFILLCETEFPHLKLKDLVSQALLDFTKNYSPKK